MILLNAFAKRDVIYIFALLFKKGPVAEWLGTALQKLLHQFESGRDL